DGDPLAAGAAAERLVLAGAVGRAVDLWRATATMYRRRSNGAAARSATRRADELQATLEPASTRPLLGERERQMASLAAARWQNREIAEALGVSVRTVENTLAKVFRKVGAAGRTDLRVRLEALGQYDATAVDSFSD
ncbi:MAG TPA: hypothetical protein DCR14_14970, partial [Acidimicrobiaceae bacterium]|nr:hypothetical protein [Acidimicrobiaceae bacterium]